MHKSYAWLFLFEWIFKIVNHESQIQDLPSSFDAELSECGRLSVLVFMLLHLAMVWQIIWL